MREKMKRLSCLLLEAENLAADIEHQDCAGKEDTPCIDEILTGIESLVSDVQNWLDADKE